MPKFFVLTVLLAILLREAKAQEKQDINFEPVVVVELFTSQGCGECFDADNLFLQVIEDGIEKKTNLIPLSFHIDYWNLLGWQDSFSAEAFTNYQRKYIKALKIRGIYSPQFIVNGFLEFGTDKKKLQSAINQTLHSKPLAGFSKLIAIYEEGKPPRVKYVFSGDTANSKINFALVSKKEVTSVKAGDNKGRKIKNENVVRQFITINSRTSGEVSFNLSPLPQKDNMAIIAYIQRNGDMRIIGASIAENP